MMVVLQELYDPGVEPEYGQTFVGWAYTPNETNPTNIYTIEDEDYIEYGLLREFFGRIKVITNTKGYTKEDLKKILLESEISPLKNLSRELPDRSHTDRFLGMWLFWGALGMFSPSSG